MDFSQGMKEDGICEKLFLISVHDDATGV